MRCVRSPPGCGISADISRDAIDAELAALGPPLVSRLTKREREIFELIIRGYSNNDIAPRLFISLRTVETHRHRITRKLSARTIVEMQRVAASTADRPVISERLAYTCGVVQALLDETTAGNSPIGEAEAARRRHRPTFCSTRRASRPRCSSGRRERRGSSTLRGADCSAPTPSSRVCRLALAPHR